jgi:hypothetical protein
MMKRRFGVIAALGLLVASSLAATLATPSAGVAQNENLQPTVQAMQTQISGLQTQVAQLMPPTPRPGVTPSPTKAARSSSGTGASMTSPIALGSTARVGDYQIRVVAVDYDAQAEVLAANRFNDPAPPGKTMVMATLEFTYVGSEKGDVFWDLTYTIVGTDGLAFSDTDSEARCGVEPNGLTEAPKLYAGAQTQANVCWIIKKSAAGQPIMVLDVLFDWNSKPVYFALYD